MQDVTLTVTLTLQGPILTHSTAPGASHLSSPFARNARGEYTVPGSLIKGRLREAWTELESVVGDFLQGRCGLTIEQLLGSGSGNQRNNGLSTQPKRGRLHFEDFVDGDETVTSSGEEQVRYRIKLDEARGSVSKGAYQVIEAPYAAGEEARFVGQIRFRAKDAGDVQKIKECVEIGLRWVTNIGANCNVGFGRLLDVQLTDSHPPATTTTASVTATGAERLEIQITPLSPFCVSRRRIADNLFESEDIIPGAVLKGCVAHTWRTLRGDDPDGEISTGYDPSRAELCEHFHAVRFTHAFPAECSQGLRPVTAPLSLVKLQGQEGALYDVAQFREPILIAEPNVPNKSKWSAPNFDIDWKDNRDVKERFGWESPKRELRVRTAIDANLRKAKEEQLFAYEMVVPDGVTWHGSIDLSAITDLSTRAKVEEQLAGLLINGLRGLGKTKAEALVSVSPAGSAPPIHASDPAPRIDAQSQQHSWIVTLQTPALLCDPEDVKSNGLLEAYRRTWDKLSSFTLHLEYFFARQSLSGGYYLYRRFMKPGEYYPYLLTDPGSVFVLSAVPGKEPEAQTCIEDLLAHGLPIPELTLPAINDESLRRDDWRSCPYLREGGYGEIAVNLCVHFEHRPQEVKSL
jgi:CRISPR/Cas system CSM-associated protein Csm3 (group 7 of RAMP superfamily)